jgi:transglutaminase-like putative cysteine protease
VSKKCFFAAAAAVTLISLLPGTHVLANAVPDVPAKAPATTAVPPARPDDLKALILNAPSALAYPNANKATLLDLADITVNPDGTARTLTRQSVKIFNKLAREQESEVKIPYTGGYEKVKILRARTIRPDGSVINVRPEDIRDHELNDEQGEYSDARVVSFSMPAVEEGCILDYEYETTQTSSKMPGNFWTDWYFQSGTDPVMLSRLTVTSPKSLKLNELYKNTAVRPKSVPSADGKTITQTWEAKNVAPIDIEPMMPPADRVIPAMHLSTVSDWQTVADWYSGLAKDRAVVNDTVKARALALTKDLKTPEEKAKAIFYYVEEKTRYVALEFGQGAYQPRSAAVTCDTQYGDCKDMATLLVAMLGDVGITAHPVLLKVQPIESSRTDPPSPSAFNHAICLAEINGKKYWLDATAQVVPWGEIPSSDRGADAFVIRNGKGAFETIPYATAEENRRDVLAKITLNPDGSAKGTIEMQGNGEWDLFMRTQFSYLTPDRVRPFMQSMAQNIGPNARVTDYKVSDVGNKDQPVKITMSVEFPAWAAQSGDLLLFKARPEQTGGGQSSPLREDGRRLPIAQQKAGLGNSVLELTLPSGYSLFSAPKPTEVKSDLGKFTRTVTTSADKIIVSTRGEDYRSEVPATRYDEMRTYFDKFQRASDELVIIRKADAATAQATQAVSIK